MSNTVDIVIIFGLLLLHLLHCLIHRKHRIQMAITTAALKDMTEDMEVLQKGFVSLNENDQIIVGVLNTAFHKERDSVTEITGAEYHEIKED